MKKMFVLGIVIPAIILGFTACDGTYSEKGGTLKLVNNTGKTYFFKILFEDTFQRVNDEDGDGEGAYIIYPGQGQKKLVQAVSDFDTSYVVYGDLTSNASWIDELWYSKLNSDVVGAKRNVLWYGDLSGGETVELRFSTLDDE